MRNPRPLFLESLEDRLCPATYGIAWPDARHLTISFAPDGTNVGGVASNMFAEMGLLNLSNSWQSTILRAFETWASVANINFTVVADGGQAFGSPGAVQGDPRFGDIRIGSGPVSATDLAMTSPFDTGDTWAGDVVFSQATMGLLSPVELYNVALHEAGHALGLPANPNDPQSVMYPLYLGQNLLSLDASDVANIQALYGPRQPNAFGGAAGNTLAAAAAVPFGPAFDADLTSPSDADFYQVTTTSAGNFQVALRTSGLSLTTARLTVFNAAGQVISSAVAPDPLHGDLTLQVNNAAAGASYFVEVQGANNDVFSVGAYRLAIGSSAGAFVATTPTAPAWSGAGHNTPATAVVLPLTQSVASDLLDHSLRASLTTAGEVDYYQVTAPAAPAGGPEALLVTVYGLGGNAPAPTATVYDASGNVVAAQILKNDAGGYIEQVTSVTPGATYYVKVAAGSLGAATGTYQLALDFRQPVVTNPLTFASGQLSALQPSSTTPLTVTQGRLFRFNLQTNAPSSVQFSVTITDLLGNVVANLPAGVSSGLWLNPGAYLIHVTASSSGPLPPLTYALVGDKRNDHDGLDPEDTTYTPSQPSSQSPPPSSSSASPPPAYYYSPPPSGTSSSGSGTTTTTDPSSSSSTTTSSSSSGTTTTTDPSSSSTTTSSGSTSTSPQPQPQPSGSSSSASTPPPSTSSSSTTQPTPSSTSSGSTTTSGSGSASASPPP
jgi:hypothetical protein